MKSPFHTRFLIVFALPGIFAACADRAIVNVGTQLGASAQGLKDGYPSKVSVGYDRTEIAWLPRGSTSSLVGGYDAEFSAPNGIAVAEVLASGKAASQSDAASSTTRYTPSNIPFADTMIVSTTTRTNLGIEAATADGPSPSLNFGFKRTILAMFPSLQQEKRENGENQSNELPSAYMDITIHASGLGTKNAAPGIHSSRRLGADQGFRTVQTIAMGEAAEIAAKNEQIGAPLIQNVKDRIAQKPKTP